MAHLAVKRHTWRFWNIVGIIYSEYEKGKEELMKMHGVKAVTTSVVLHTYKLNGKEVFE